jgi:hypothetical protein
MFRARERRLVEPPVKETSVKPFCFALAILATATTTACVEMEDADDELALEEIDQESVVASGCDVFVDLTTTGTGGVSGSISGARYRAYSCENINFYIETGGHDWSVTTWWDGEYYYNTEDCSDNWLRTRLERVAPSPYGDLGTSTVYAGPEQYWGYLNGVPAQLTRCSHPSKVRNLAATRHYKLSVKSWGAGPVYPHDGRDQTFDFAFRRL